MRVLVTISFIAFVLVGCASTTNSGTSGGGGLNSSPVPYTAKSMFIQDSYSNDFSASVIQQFSMSAATTQSSTAPLAYTGLPTHAGFSGLTIDPSGVVYAVTLVNLNGNGTTSVRRFTAAATGGTAFQTNYDFYPRVVNNSYTSVNDHSGIAADKSGYFYVVTNGLLYQYGPSASGSYIVPNWSRQVCTTGTYQYIEAMTVDASSNLYVECGKSIYVFNVGVTSTSSVARTIALPSTASFVYGIAVDASQNLFVLSSAASLTPNPVVSVYTASQSGAATPVRTISGSNTKLANPQGLAVDSGGMVYVSDYDANEIRQVYCFAPGVSGNVVPYLSFDTNSHIGVNYSSGSIAVF